MVSILSAFSANAAPSILKLKVFNNEYFVVTLDNVQYKNTTNYFISKELQPGNHSLKVTKKGPQYGHQYNTSIIFNGTINIPGGFTIEAMIDKANKFVISSKTPLNNPNNNNNGNNNNNYNHNGNNNSNYNNNGNNYNSNNNGNYNHNEDHNHHHSQGNNENNNNLLSKAMNNEDFHQLKMSIDSKSFENTKLEIAKQATSSNWLTCDQVVEIIKLFSFENTKLDFAKFAYGKTVDKNKYYLVSNAFTFESSIKNLNQYISKFKE